MDNKLTDNEIIKDLEEYIKENEFEYLHSSTMGEYPLIRKALYLINRLQKEKEQLEKNKESLVISYANAVARNLTIKDEAYMEVEEKIEKIAWYHINQNGELVMGANSETDTPLYKAEDIYNLLKELVGE